MAPLRRVWLPLLFLSTSQASEIIGADGKEYHPKRHHHQKHHHEHHHGKSSHVDPAVASLPVAAARPVRFNLDAPTTHHHHGAISSNPALGHVTAPAAHHSELHHLRKHHKIHMLNEHNHMLNHKTEPKDEEKTDDEKKDDENKDDEKKEEKKSKKEKAPKEKSDKKETAGDEKSADDEDEKKDESKDKKKAKEESDDSEESEEKDKDEAAGGSKAKWSNGKKGGPLPVQGYDEYHDGETVEHEDMKSLTSDWQKEFGPNMKGMDSYREICEKYPDNEWCQLHRGVRQYGQPERSWNPMRSQARRMGSILSFGLLAACLASLQ